MRALPVWLAMFLVSGPAAAGIVWRGDFETGDRSQYTGAQMVSPDRLQVVTAPVAEGRHALKATVRQGDDPIHSSGNRNELVYQGGEAVGSEYYYRWKVMFAPDFPSVHTWQLFTQWHHEGCCGSPPVEFFVYGEELRLTLNDSVTPWRAPLVRGVWHEFIFHVKWSPDPKVGFIELWHNRELVLPRRLIATMYAGMKNYLKVGLYRSDTVSQVGVVYHDGFIQATRLEDVLPPPPSAPDAGTSGPVTPSPDAGTPPPDAGTPQADAGTSGHGPVRPTPDLGEPEAPSSSEAHAPVHGCSASGEPFAILTMMGLLGMIRARRHRRGPRAPR